MAMMAPIAPSILALPKAGGVLWSRPQHKAPVAQLDRATVYGTVGYRFEPGRVHKSFQMRDLQKV
jgi:hypothetical protein